MDVFLKAKISTRIIRTIHLELVKITCTTTISFAVPYAHPSLTLESNIQYNKKDEYVH